MDFNKLNKLMDKQKKISQMDKDAARVIEESGWGEAEIAEAKELSDMYPLAYDVANVAYNKMASSLEEAMKDTLAIACLLPESLRQNFATRLRSHFKAQAVIVDMQIDVWMSQDALLKRDYNGEEVP